MEDILIVRSNNGNCTYNVVHVNWHDGEPQLIKMLEEDCTFDYACDVRAHFVNALGIKEED